MTPRETALRDAAEAVLKVRRGITVLNQEANLRAALDALAEAVRAYEDEGASAEPVATGWAVMWPNTPMPTVRLSPTEQDAWARVFGDIATEKIIDAAKARGARAFRVEVREIGNE